MLSSLEETLGQILVRHGRSAQLLEYTPYLLCIGSMLGWFIRGLWRDTRIEFRYRARRRRLRLIRGRPAVAPAPLKSGVSSGSPDAWPSHTHRSSR